MFTNNKIRKSPNFDMWPGTFGLVCIFAFGMFIQSCSDMSSSVADPDQKNTDISKVQPDNTLLMGSISDPVVINGYTVTFSGKSTITNSEGDVYSTFSYNVAGDGVTAASNNFVMEVPTCAGSPTAYSPLQSAKVSTNSITWESSLSSSSNRNYSITYSGDLPVGYVNATINSGNTTETKEVPGPCKGIYSISGFVYVDANSNEVKNQSESGIGNVTVHLVHESGEEYSQKTTPSGSFLFSVFTGSNSVDFTVEVRSETADMTDFNEQLFSSYTATTMPPSYDITVLNSDSSNNNFGFLPETQKILSQFSDGSILLNTEEPKFWIQQLRFASKNNRNAVISATEFEQYLTDIEGLLLDDPFKFGDNKIETALDILTRPTKTDLDVLLVELLAAELNIVSGRGSNSLDFDLALISFGESVAADLLSTASANNLMSNSTTDAVQFSTSSTLTSTSDAQLLLSSFNRSGSGGGVGTN
jgi:hypothetical protein